jgi:hypothetical protein
MTPASWPTCSSWPRCSRRTTPSSPPLPSPEPARSIAEASRLTAGYLAGDAGSFRAFRDLAQLLLQLTILDAHEFVQLSREVPGPDRAPQRVLGGRGGLPTRPVRLRDGRYLRVSVALWLADTADGRRLKVSDSSYQYQADRDGEQEIFRFDYLRQPHRLEPAAHLNLYADLAIPGVLPAGRPHSRVHYPTGRVPLEAVIRLLADDFQVPCATPDHVWRPVLRASEQAFHDIAHRP